MKLTLGTGNFNSSYSIKKSLNTKLKRKIIAKAVNCKIKFFDTAPVYGNAESLLGSLNLKNCKIITKIPKINFSKNINKSEWIVQNVKKSLKKLNKKKIYGLLIHDFEDFLNYKKDFMFAFENLKKNKLVSKIGISLYNHNDIFSLIKFWSPDIIQIPYNIFDRRIEDKKFIHLIKKNKIQLHARSIFLKGILVNKNIKLNKLKRWKKKINRWFLWCKKNNLQPQKACFLFVANNRFIQNIVMSFDNCSQISEIIKIRKKKINFPNYSIKDKALLNPYNW